MVPSGKRSGLDGDGRNGDGDLFLTGRRIPENARELHDAKPDDFATTDELMQVGSNNNAASLSNVMQRRR